SHTPRQPPRRKVLHRSAVPTALDSGPRVRRWRVPASRRACPPATLHRFPIPVLPETPPSSPQSCHLSPSPGPCPATPPRPWFRALLGTSPPSVQSDRLGSFVMPPLSASVSDRTTLLD